MFHLIKGFCFYVGWFYGDPHINTLDGRMYTFNGRGEYTLVSLGEEFELQARTEPMNTYTGATQFTACAMRGPNNETHIEVDFTHIYCTLTKDNNSCLLAFTTHRLE